jgi:hypothetical protein
LRTMTLRGLAELRPVRSQRGAVAGAAGCTCSWAPAGMTRREARPDRCRRPAAAGGLRRPRFGSGGRSAPARCRARPPAPGNGLARPRRDGRLGGSTGLAAERRLRRRRRSWHGSRLQDRSGSSMACWPVASLQLTSGGSSSQCAPVGLSSARWNDNGNDIPLAGSSNSKPHRQEDRCQRAGLIAARPRWAATSRCGQAAPRSSPAACHGLMRWQMG